MDYYLVLVIFTQPSVFTANNNNSKTYKNTTASMYKYSQYSEDFASYKWPNWEFMLKYYCVWCWGNISV